jgi:hypothetical protein
MVEDDEHHYEDEGLFGLVVECGEAREGGRRRRGREVEGWGDGAVKKEIMNMYVK